MIKKILIALVTLIVVFVIVAALQPSDLLVSRSATISAPQATVFEYVNDLHKWQTWSPWAKLDPAAKNTFTGPPAGTGASFSWVGNNEVGEGSMTITESRPGELVRFKLEFKKPFEDSCIAEFIFKPEGDKTVVTWSMIGTKKFIGKVIGLIMDCDKMLGDQFESGLANLNALVTTPTQK